MSLSKNNKMLQFVNYRMRVTLDDRRTLVGRFLAFDIHMNVVLADCEEFRRAKKSDKEERRALGLVLLRGECVVSVAVESPPPAARKGVKRSAADAHLPAGGPIPSAGRGGPLPGTSPGPPHAAVPGLAGPAPGLGAPAVAAMQPSDGADPRLYATHSSSTGAHPSQPPSQVHMPGQAMLPFARGAPMHPYAAGGMALPPGGGMPPMPQHPPHHAPYGRGMPPAMDRMAMPGGRGGPLPPYGRGGGRGVPGNGVGGGRGGPSAPTSG